MIQNFTNKVSKDVTCYVITALAITFRQQQQTSDLRAESGMSALRLPMSTSLSGSQDGSIHYK